jgi:hypothetical protein
VKLKHFLENTLLEKGLTGRGSRLLDIGRSCTNYYIVYAVLAKLAAHRASQTLYSAAVGAAQSLLGSPRYGQAV